MNHVRCFGMLMALLSVAAHTSFGSIIAADIASDPAYDPPGYWETGDNGGFGFSSWTIGTDDTAQLGAAAATIYDSTDNGTFTPTGGINTSGESFGLYATVIGAQARIAAFRGFDFNGDSNLDPLGVGSTFGISMDNGLIQAGQTTGQVGFTLRNGNSATGPFDYSMGSRFEFWYRAGDANYSISDSTFQFDTGIPVTDNGLRLNFTLTGANTYTLVVSNAPGTLLLGSYNRTLAGSGAIESFAPYNLWADGPYANQIAYVYFNSFAVSQPDAVPEPTTSLLLASGSLLVFSWRWQRSRK